MKLLREYIRQTLLLESIDSKIASQITKLQSLNGFIKINLTKRQNITVQAHRFDDLKNFSFNNGEIGHVFALHEPGKLGPCNNALIIGGSWDGEETYAKEGIGPLLYDLVMELTTLVGKDGLGPDYESVSDDAYSLWAHYLNNRNDIVVKQRDITQSPRTTPKSDDCTEDNGYRAAAKRFPGGAIEAYDSEPTYEDWDNTQDHPKNPGGKFSAEFLDFWFDPTNPLTKTYHKNGTSVLKLLRQEKMLLPAGAKQVGMPYSQDEMQEIWDRTWGNLFTGNHQRIPWISKIWERTAGFDVTVLKERHPDAPWDRH